MYYDTEEALDLMASEPWEDGELEPAFTEAECGDWPEFWADDARIYNEMGGDDALRQVARQYPTGTCYSYFAHVTERGACWPVDDSAVTDHYFEDALHATL